MNHDHVMLSGGTALASDVPKSKHKEDREGSINQLIDSSVGNFGGSQGFAAAFCVCADAGGTLVISYGDHY